MPTSARRNRPDPLQMDMGCLLEDAESSGREDPATETEAQQRLVAAAARLESQFVSDADAAWETSPYRWIRSLATVRKARAAERLLVAALADLGVVAAQASGPGHDFSYAGVKHKIRLSMLWESGELVFQQCLAGDADVICLLGICPDRARLWVVPRPVLADLLRDSATGWLSFDAGRAPDWLAEYGGDVSAAAGLIRRGSDA